MEAMREFPDGYFDLAVCDPPYGINVKSFGNGSRKKIYDRSSKGAWDYLPPTEEYFVELFRVSKEQIIWGSNYFKLPPSKCFIVWDKNQNEKVSFAMAELAWASFSSKSMIYYGSPKDGERIHPTQKPVALYDWIYKNYLPEGGKVIDTHLGSGSNRIAAYKRGNIDFWSYETDPDYFREGNERFEKAIALPLFDAPKPAAIQLTI